MDQTAATQEPEYMTIAEISRLFRCSPDTTRRRIAAGKLRDIEWVDFFGDGRLRATAESVKRYQKTCHDKMEKFMRLPLRRKS